jgi:hypothetical protein
MRIGSIVAISASYSLTSRQELVRILQILSDLTYKVEYPNGIVETLPIGAFIGY